MAEAGGGLYFFLYPAGHFGLTAVTLLVTLPLMQVIVVFFLDATATLFLVAPLIAGLDC
jgi:hypothetical protein